MESGEGAITQPSAPPTMGDYFDKPAAEPTGNDAPVDTPVTTPTTEPEKKIVAEPTAARIKDAPVVAPPAKPEPTPTNWKEAIAKEKLEDVIEALGLDKDFAKIAAYRKNNGDLKPYFDAYKNDYNTIQPEEILRLQINKEQGLSDEEKTQLYEIELGKYKLDPTEFTEKEIADSKLLLKRDTNAYREQLKKEQTAMLVAPTDPMAKLKADADTAWANEQAENKAYETGLLSNDFTKAVLENKAVAIGKGKEAFNLEVTEPQLIADLLTGKADASKFQSTEDGKPDFAKQYKAMLFLTNPEAYEKALIEHGKVLGKAATIKEPENLQPFGTPPIKADQMSDEYMAVANGRPVRR